MDGERFDALARALAGAANRRSLFKGVALAIGALAPFARTRLTLANPTCGVACVDNSTCNSSDDGCYSCCGSVCVNVFTDTNNCGGCGLVCAGGQYAVCSRAGCSLQCPDGFTACGDGSFCADLANDPQNCIFCGNACPGGQTCCGAVGCIDLTIDLHNCGACGTDCGIGGRCCGSACIDPNSDSGNCGDCGVACAANQICQAAACAAHCPVDQLFCNAACVDPQSDPGNCGACGAACAADQICKRGACAARCPGGQLFCDPNCVDAQNDAANCGACGTACNGTHRCQGGVCVSTCAAGTTDCGSYCADLTSDQNNCGACGTACSRETSCVNGNCVRPECPNGQTRCQDGCFDTKTDASHCGGCNNVCLSSDFACCGGACFDLKTDPNHCGRCDFVCPPGFTCDGKGCVRQASGTGTAGESRLASPDFCVTNARSKAVIDALLSAGGLVTPPPTPSPSAGVAWTRIAKGVNVTPKPASLAFAQTIADTVVQVSACGSANDPARQTALMTDSFASSWLAEHAFTAEMLAAKPVPLRPESWSVLSTIDHVYDLGNNQASALVAFAPLAPALPAREEIHLFAKTGDQWLLDGIRSKHEFTAATGSLLTRLFDCSSGNGACSPSPELQFDYEMTSAGGTGRKSSADAKFIDAGLLLWSNLPPGVVHLRAIVPAGADVHVTSGAALTPTGEFIVVIPAGSDPAVIDLFHERSAITDAVLKLRLDADCPPCSRKDTLKGICAPTCPPCSNCRSVQRADGRFVSTCEPSCSGDQRCEPGRAKGAAACCAPTGAACAADGDCCAGGACQHGVCGCAPEGSSCGQANCCAGFDCTGKNSTCAACKPIAAACASDKECCDGACVAGTCRCCAGVDEGDHAKTGLCCVYPQTLLAVPKSAAGPAFKRCCTPGVDCLGDAGGPSAMAGVIQDDPRVCRI